MLITLTLWLASLRAERLRRDDGVRLASRRGRVASPDGFDGEQVLADASRRFVRLQAAWDARDLGLLKSLTTPDLYDDLCHVIAACETAGATRTDVISLHAELLGLEQVGAAWLASVEFSGLIRESTDAGAVPFRELWMLAADPAADPGWRLARQQALL